MNLPITLISQVGLHGISYNTVVTLYVAPGSEKLHVQV